MEIYMVRHAATVPHGTPGVAEDDRPLTGEGIEKMHRASRGLAALGVLPEIILTSPLPRAKQTAEIVQATLGDKIPLKLVPALGPSGSRSELYEEMQQHENRASLMLVGHQPSLGEIAGEIAWGSAENCLELKKGGACCLDLLKLRPVPRGTLVWLLTPAVLRKMAR